jgi:FMN phosphatase YigB (HAD superfamily)
MGGLRETYALHDPVPFLERRDTQVVECIIFDLSEVLIAGLKGTEKALSRQLSMPPEEILSCFEGRAFGQLLVGSISEERYLRNVIAKGKWRIEVATLKAVIRRNFHSTVPGTIGIVENLGRGYELALLSDHAREWIAYIETVHPFLDLFEHTFYSFALGATKQQASTFERVLDMIGVPPGRCLFIDDNATNIRVAEAVGIPSIRFLDVTQLAVELDRALNGGESQVVQERSTMRPAALS